MKKIRQIFCLALIGLLLSCSDNQSVIGEWEGASSFTPSELTKVTVERVNDYDIIFSEDSIWTMQYPYFVSYAVPYEIKSDSILYIESDTTISRGFNIENGKLFIDKKELSGAFGQNSWTRTEFDQSIIQTLKKFAVNPDFLLGKWELNADISRLGYQACPSDPNAFDKIEFISANEVILHGDLENIKIAERMFIVDDVLFYITFLNDSEMTLVAESKNSECPDYYVDLKKLSNE
ncbi:MAG: hypothetical protein ACI9J3_001870 [Parvicellaceae bacterium]|jgi:hypothetical protein